MNSVAPFTARSTQAMPVLPGDSDPVYPDYPVERRVRSQAHAFQHGFSTEAAKQLDGQFVDVVFVPGRRGLQLLARDELALRWPIDALAASHGDALDYGATQVRFRHDDPVHEPVMNLLVCVPYSHYAPVRLDLAERGACCVETELGSRTALIRGQARQAELLGYPEWLDRTTEGFATVRLGLSHYAPVAP